MLISTLLVVAALLIHAAFEPDRLRPWRSATITAPSDEVLALINHLRRRNESNPFAGLDGQGGITYDAVTAGLGGACDWPVGRDFEAGLASPKALAEQP